MPGDAISHGQITEQTLDWELVHFFMAMCVKLQEMNDQNYFVFFTPCNIGTLYQHLAEKAE